MGPRRRGRHTPAALTRSTGRAVTRTASNWPAFRELQHVVVVVIDDGGDTLDLTTLSQTAKVIIIIRLDGIFARRLFAN